MKKELRDGRSNIYIVLKSNSMHLIIGLPTQSKIPSLLHFLLMLFLNIYRQITREIAIEVLELQLTIGYRWQQQAIILAMENNDDVYYLIYMIICLWFGMLCKLNPKLITIISD